MCGRFALYSSKMTRRQEIIKILEKNPTSLYQLANHFRTIVKDILEDMDHIEKTLHPRKLKRIPARCRSCDFVFKERSMLKTPSRCPRCKSERIMAQLFYI